MSITYGEMRTAEEVEVDQEILKRVRRGIKWLEENVGPDWVDRIDPSTLSIQSTNKCILGQLFDDPEQPFKTGYGIARNKYPELGRDEDYGFDCDESVTYQELQEVWLREITPIVRHNS